MVAIGKSPNTCLFIRLYPMLFQWSMPSNSTEHFKIHSLSSLVKKNYCIDFFTVSLKSCACLFFKMILEKWLLCRSHVFSYGFAHLQFSIWLLQGLDLSSRSDGTTTTGTGDTGDRSLGPVAGIIGKMVGKPLGWGPLNNQPYIFYIYIYSGYLLGPISPFKGLQQGGF